MIAYKCLQLSYRRHWRIGRRPGSGDSLFKELSPHLGMAYVLVLHLDPARESAVTEILGRATRMPVLQVKEACAWKPITSMSFLRIVT
jgi:hypothetical protein